jgi:ATP-binding cassette subfamily C protein CydC
MSHRTSDPLHILLPMLEIPRPRLLAAVGAAATTLAAAFALAAVSAWTMPPVLDLTVAVVAVRALGVSRGAFRWLDRILTHDVALRGVVRLRTNLFTALARRSGDALSRLRRGDLLARLGDDAQELGDLVIRAVVPALVALVMTVVVVLTIAPLSIPAAAVMLLALLLAGFGAPLLAYRAAVISEQAVLTTRGAVTGTTLEILDDADALRVRGGLEGQLGDLRSAQEAHDGAIDRAAVPAALAAACVPAVMLSAVLGSVLAAGEAWATGSVSAGVVGMLVLVPLSSFEAVTSLPAAATQLARSRSAAERLVQLLDEPAVPPSAAQEPAPPVPSPSLASVPHLRARDLSVGWEAASPRVRSLDLDLPPGTRMAVLGPSGIGKSTLLLTLAGLLEPLSGTVELDGHPLARLPEELLRERVVSYAEDAHVFATSLTENLRTVRGDITEEEIDTALGTVGLRDWVHSLPHGTATQLGADGTTISGGERRRLLLARAVLRRAPVTLLDEPTEHLDLARGDALLRRLLTPGDPIVGPEDGTVLVVTHRVSAVPSGTPVLRLGTDRTAVLTTIEETL